jgi:hypothetical protein
MTKATPAETLAAPTNKAKVNGQPPKQAPGRVISDPQQVAQLVMMRIDHVNSKKTNSPSPSKRWPTPPSNSSVFMQNNRHRSSSLKNVWMSW